MYYVVISGKVVTKYLALCTRRRSNNKQKASNAITEIVPQDFMKLLGEFKDLPYLGFIIKQSKSELTEDSFFLVSHLIQYNNHVLLRD